MQKTARKTTAKYPVEIEEYLTAKTAVQIFFGRYELGINNSLPRPKVQEFLLSIGLVPVAGKIHPCQLETEHWQKLHEWLVSREPKTKVPEAGEN